jgi:dipeptidase E
VSDKRLLLLSNSTNAGEPFLQYPSAIIQEFLGSDVKRILFVPFAGVRITFESYAAMVRERMALIGFEVDSIADAKDPVASVREAEAIMIGGGNTFHLLRGLYQANVLNEIRERVESGIPYVGWSAGSNVAAPTIKTTNDMPIVEPPSLGALNLVPFQLNPHFTNESLPGQRGETREDRLAEFTKVNPNVYVVGLREGTMLRLANDELQLIGSSPARIFVNDAAGLEIAPGANVQFLLGKAPPDTTGRIVY